MSPVASPASRREIWSWACYDLAMSAYSTVVVVVFATYFTEVVIGGEGLALGGWRLEPEAVWTWAVSLSMLVVAVSAPVLGAMADYTASKKRFLFGFCYAGVTATAFMYLVGPGDVWLGVLVYVVSNMALEWGMGFYNGFLPEIAPPEHMGRISGFGWALGYAGSVLCLSLNAVMIEYPGWFGIPDTGHLPVRLSLLVVALWWGLFAIPIFVWLRERAVARQAPPGTSYLRAGFGRFWKTLRQFRRYPELVKLLIAFLLYNDGVQTVIVIAAVFGSSVLGMAQGELLACYIVIHVVAFFGALGFGRVADRYSTKTAIHVNLAVWTAVVIYVLFVDHAWEFWILGVCVGFVLGGIQACSRALLAHFTPARNSAEFFGFLSTAGRFASIFGPLILGMTTQLTGSLRTGVVSIVVFFLLGWAIFFMVDEQKGRAEGARPVSE